MENTSKLIGKGDYGCIYKPPIKCKHLHSLDKKHKNDVMKVRFVGDLSNALETEISYEVRNIDPNNTFFIPLESDNCTPDETDVDLQECPLYEKHGSPYAFTGSFQVYGGLNLEQYLKSNSPTIEDVFNWTKHLLEGLNLLHNNGILHLDIGLQNVVIDDNLNVRIIDFGLSNFVEEFSLDLNIEPYNRYPLFYNVLRVDNVDYLYETYEPMAMTFVDNYQKGTKSDIIQLLYNLSRNKQQYFNNAILSDNYWLQDRILNLRQDPGMYKIDSYMFAMMIKEVLDKYKMFPIVGGKQIYDLLYKMIDFGLDIIPKEQFNIKQLYTFILNGK